MNYLSFGFLFFVIVLFAMYNFLNQKYRWILLLVASIFFYMTFDIKYIFFLLFVSLSTYWCAQTFQNDEKKRIFLWTCIVLNVGVWFLIKGFPWWGSNLSKFFGIFGVQLEVPTLIPIVPIGISYYVLQAIGYLVDVYRGKTKPETISDICC